MAPLLVAALHTKAYSPEQPVKTHDYRIKREVNTHLHILMQLARRPINHKSKGQDREPQCRVVVMYVGDATHNDKGQVVQEPSNDRIDTCVMNLIQILWLQLVVATLPADSVPNDHQGEYAQRGGGCPVHEWVAEEEVLDCVVVPRAHAQTDIEDGPLPES